MPERTATARLEERIHELLAGEKGERVCQDLSEAACDAYPRNFAKLLAAMAGSKSGDHLSKPGLVLTWLLTALGAPSAAIGLLAPVREAGSLLPQMIVGAVVRRFAIRKGFAVAGAAAQGLCVVGMGAAALLIEGTAAAWTVVGLLVVFSLARGVSSIASKDLLGKTVPKTRRGRLSGIASSVSGWLAVGVGVYFALNRGEEVPVAVLATLLFVAGGMWLLSALVMAGLLEQPSGVSGGGNALEEGLASFRFLRDDPVFRRFCVARALLASTVLSMPFYVVLAHEATGGRLAGLGWLMIAGSLATALSAAAWGRFSDRSSRLTFAFAGAGAGAVGLLMVVVSGFETGEGPALWIYGGLFFLIGLAHTGIRLGRKTYLIDHGNEENRARLIAVSNTLMGAVLLASGSFGLLAGILGERAVVLVFALLGLAGSAMACRLPEIGTETDSSHP